jgi:NADH dehydrogenase
MNVVTGAFGYTGKYIAHRLLSMGMRVKTLTTRTDRPDPFGGQVSVSPLNFDDAREMATNLEGADVLYNTYWVRFPRGGLTFDRAVHNTRVLVKAAEDAGVRRIVHISITNADSGSHLPYFKGKGLAERAVKDSGMSHAIVRPTMIFGREDILLNNIAWFLRRSPVFAVFGAGGYRVQPVFVDDVAELAVRAGQTDEALELDAAGPETFTFDELVRLTARSVGSRARLLHVRPGLGLLLGRLMGYAVRDVVITRDEIEGLMAGLLVSDKTPECTTSLPVWLRENGETLGKSYASELRRHYK